MPKKQFTRILIFSLFITPFVVFTQNENTNFVLANKLYQKQNYNQAIEIYHKIENNNLQSAALYFNLANAYYKTNKVAPSIYYYEKALKLEPNNKDTKFNLSFAKRMTIDNIEKLPETIFQKLSKNIIQKLSFNQWAYSSIFFIFLFAFLFLRYHFLNTTTSKRLFFITSIFSMLFAILSLLFAFHTYKITSSKKEAIIFVQQTSVKNAPIMSSETIFELHEGTKVQILESVDNWQKIKIDDGQTGWIIATELKEI